MSRVPEQIIAQQRSGPVVALVTGFCVLLLELINLSLLNGFQWAAPVCNREIDKQDVLARSVRNAENLAVTTALLSAVAFIGGIVAALRSSPRANVVWWWALFITAFIWAPFVTFTATETRASQSLFSIWEPTTRGQQKGRTKKVIFCDSLREDLRYQPREQRMYDALGTSSALQLAIGIILFLLVIFSAIPTLGGGGALAAP